MKSRTKINKSYYSYKPNKMLLKTKFEDVNVLNSIERIFLKKRGYVFKLPKPKSPVILLMSGGLDSICMTNFLLDKFKLRLFPLFIRWGQMNIHKEEAAFDYFSRYFSRKCKSLFMDPIKVDAPIPIRELSNGVKDIVVLRNTTFAVHAVHYAHYLENTTGDKIRTIFCSSVANDGNIVPDSTLTAIRATNLNICLNESDFEWQYTSIALEKTLGFYLAKPFFIKYAAKRHLPLGKTWSCYRKSEHHCGNCLPCMGRKEAFILSKVKDPTIYSSSHILQKLAARLSGKILKIFSNK